MNCENAGERCNRNRLRRGAYLHAEERSMIRMLKRVYLGEVPEGRNKERYMRRDERGA
jgi:hypothetical protein